jgi:predicted sulfurtransferase
MYCTGGIRCEKASAYFKHQGFEKVYQLDGGIIEYAREAKKKGLKNKFRGKNFVFDERMGERISEEIISQCHQNEQKKTRVFNGSKFGKGRYKAFKQAEGEKLI